MDKTLMSDFRRAKLARTERAQVIIAVAVLLILFLLSGLAN